MPPEDRVPQTPLPTDPNPPPIADSPFLPRIANGSQIGPYVVVAYAGAGGMGEVYRAKDPRLDRDVAIKMLRSDDAGGERARARLVREAQAMAKLSHPNVVAVHEVGTYDDMTYLVMDFIAGKTLRGWLRHGRSRQEILDVFVQAARGLAAAHRVRLVHRDFKPDNVLVDEEGRARVTDFGIAGIIDDADEPPVAGVAEAQSVFTQGSILRGTPAYMAPEQVAGRADARVDQFAFCVALYEAVCGARPFAGGDSAELVKNIVAQRLADPARIAALPKHLRRVLVRGLSADPDARYPSMDALIAELDRDPWARRTPIIIGAGVVAVVAAVTLGLVVAPVKHARPCVGMDRKLAGIWDDAVRARIRQAFLATGESWAGDTFDRAAAALDDRAARWVAMRTEACEATAVRGEQSPALLDLRMQCLDQRVGEIAALTRVLSTDVTTKTMTSAVPAVLRLSDLSACADAEALTAVVPPPSDPAINAQVGAVRVQIANAKALNDAGQVKPGYDAALAAVAAAEKVPYPRVQAEAELQLSINAILLGDGKESEAAERAARQAAALAHDDPLFALATIHLVGTLSRAQARLPEAAELLDAAEATVDRAGRPPKLRGRVLAEREQLLFRQERWPEAINATLTFLAFAQEIDPDGPLMSTALNDLAAGYKRSGRIPEALATQERALVLMEHIYGKEHPYVAGTLINMGTILQLNGKLPEAQAALERAVAIQEKTIGADSIDLAKSLTNLGGVLREELKLPEAEAVLERALAIKRKLLRPDHPDLMTTTEGLSLVYIDEKKFDAALTLLHDALAVREAAGTGGSEMAGMIHRDIGDVYVKQEKLAEALVEYQSALDIIEKADGPDHPVTGTALVRVGTALLRLKRPAEALPLAERELALELKVGRPVSVADAEYLLALALWDSGGDKARAVDLMEKARAIRATAVLPPEVLAETEKWLAEHPRPTAKRPN